MRADWKIVSDVTRTAALLGLGVQISLALGSLGEKIIEAAHIVASACAT